MIPLNPLYEVVPVTKETMPEDCKGKLNSQRYFTLPLGCYAYFAYGEFRTWGPDGFEKVNRVTHPLQLDRDKGRRGEAGITVLGFVQVGH